MQMSDIGGMHVDKNIAIYVERASRASDVLKALAHQTRLVMLYMLVGRERTVSELEEILGIQQAIVSQQLARLRMEGLVTTRRCGRLVYYRASSSLPPAFLSSIFEIFAAETRPEAR